MGKSGVPCHRKTKLQTGQSATKIIKNVKIICAFEYTGAPVIQLHEPTSLYIPTLGSDVAQEAKRIRRSRERGKAVSRL